MKSSTPERGRVVKSSIYYNKKRLRNSTSYQKIYTKSLCQTELAEKNGGKNATFGKIRRATPTHISPAALIVFDVCLHKSFPISLYN